MSKIGEQKALEAYPICNCYNEQYMMQEDVNLESRIGYAEGYDQAMQDFLEKACEWLSKQPMSRPVFWTIEDFKNHMQNEM